MKNFRKYVLSILLCFTLTGCGQQAGFSESVSAVPESNFTESQTGVPETVMQQTDADAETAEIKSASDNVRPSKEEVLAMREKALDGMPETEISRLRENIKVANLQMESAYLYDNLFKKLSDKESPYWKYFDCKGDIQLGWWYHQAIYPKDVIMKAENITEEECAAVSFNTGNYALLCGLASLEKGKGGQALKAIICKNSGRQMLLCCKPPLVRFYEKYGFKRLYTAGYKVRK